MSACTNIRENKIRLKSYSSRRVRRRSGSVLVLAMVIFMAIAAIAAGGDIASVSKIFAPDLSSVAAYFTIPMIIYTIFGAFLNAFYSAVLVAPAAVAYRELSKA